MWIITFDIWSKIKYWFRIPFSKPYPIFSMISPVNDYVHITGIHWFGSVLVRSLLDGKGIVCKWKGSDLVSCLVFLQLLVAAGVCGQMLVRSILKYPLLVVVCYHAAEGRRHLLFTGSFSAIIWSYIVSWFGCILRWNLSGEIWWWFGRKNEPKEWKLCWNLCFTVVTWKICVLAIRPFVKDRWEQVQR